MKTSARRRGIQALALLATASLLLSLGPPARAKEPSDRTRAEFAKRKRQMLIDAGVEHIEVGKWCRNAGHVPQATAEFLRAREVSEDQLPWAQRIVDLMRRLDDKFWKFERKKTSKVMLRSYEKKTRRAAGKIQKARLKLARWAGKKGLIEESYGEYMAVIALTDHALVVDKKGNVVVEAGTLPADVSERLRREAVTINGKLYLRDAFLQKVPTIGEVHEVENERMLIRSQRSTEEAQALLAICTALLPFLEDDLGGRPTRRLNMFVFKTRADYETYCDNAGLSSHKKATGLADGASYWTLVCGEGLDKQTTTEVGMHELTHLFQYGVTRAIMPSWYNEGFAETYGGEGTFTWDGTTLLAGGPMDKGHLAGLKGDGYIPLRTLLKSDALTLINEAKGKAHHFYAESWAFLTWMRKHADEDVQERFRLWEMKCMGGALGAEVGKRNSRNFGPASQLFESTFGGELDALEAGFKAWLASG